MTRHGIRMMVFAVSCSSSVPVFAEDVIESEGRQSTGDAEMPKALYIVPWKKPALPVTASRPVTFFVNDALSSTDRESLDAQIAFHGLLQWSELEKDK